MKKTRFILALVALAFAATVAFAQQPTVGNLTGRVVDNEGKPLPGATVTISGPLGDKAFQTDADGRFEYRLVPSGTYRVRIEMEGYNPVAYSKVGVAAGQTTPLAIRMTQGKTEEVTVTSASPLVDVKRVEVQTTFKTDQAINTMPIGRNFTAAVQFAPGVVAATGTGNYAVSGSSGLENSYVIDGVNITSSGYGGIGTYSAAYGSVGTGITSDFLEEVQVKTAGFEAEYGQALGGVITGTVKSGTNDIKGRVAAYFEPRSLAAFGADAHPVSGVYTQQHDNQSIDVGLQAGGPIVKDRVFWFVAYNPTKQWGDFYATPSSTTNPAWEADPLTRSTYLDPNWVPNANQGLRYSGNTDNYAAKFNIVPTLNHRFELTAFGDPSKRWGSTSELASSPVLLAGTTMSRTVSGLNGAQDSRLNYGSDQQSLKYNGFFGGEWFLEAQYSHRKNDFKTELSSAANDYRYTDFRILRDTGYRENITPNLGGIGYYDQIQDKTNDYALRLTKTIGSHELKAGAEYFDLTYLQRDQYSGAPFIADFPTADGGSVLIPTSTGATVQVRGGFGAGGCDPTNPFWTSNCEANPQYRVTRTRINTPEPVSGREISFFLQDTWSIGDHFTAKLGVRTVNQKLEGSGGFTLPISLDAANPGFYTSAPTTFTPNSYQFKTEWSPRVGLIFDPAANGKSKFYANFARYFERVPADLAVRAFSNEVGVSSMFFRNPDLTTRFGPVADQGIAGPTQIASGTKLPYKDEYVLGFQQLVRPDLSVEVRGIYRTQGRVLEDTQNYTVEQIENANYGLAYGLPLPFPNEPNPPHTFGNYVLANPGQNTGGAFGSPKLTYKALEVQLEKRLTNNWQAFANYRYSILKGNYEGLFRTDNGQSDPNITSLFDFPNSHLMRGQYQEGLLANDRPNVIHTGATYFFPSGFEVGGIFSLQSGTPRTPLLAHPNYQNGGELPGTTPTYTYFVGGSDPANPAAGGEWAKVSTCSGNPGISPCFLYDYVDAPRGSNGRTPDISSVDLHFGYGRDFRGMRFKVNMDVTNIFNAQDPLQFNDFVERQAAILNPNYLTVASGPPNTFQPPRTVRLAVLWDW